MAQTPFNSRREDLVMLSTDTIRGEDSTTGSGDVLALRGGNSTGGGCDGADVTIGGGLAHTTGDGGKIIVASGVAPGAGTAGDIELTAATSAAGTDGTVRVNGANQSLHGGSATKRFQILGGIQDASGFVDSDGPSVFLRAQGSTQHNGAEVNIGHALLGTGNFTGRGGNAISGNSVGGNSALVAGTGFGSGNGGQITVAAGQGGAGGTGDGGDAFVSGGTAGAVNGGGGGVTITARAGNGTGTPGDISLISNGGIVKTRTTSGFGGSEKEDLTFASQTTTGPGSSVLMVVVGTLDTNGQNLKITVDSSAVNNVDDTDVASGYIVQTFYRASGTVSAMTAHVDDQTFVGTWPSTTTPSFSLVINGDDIELHFAWTGVLVGAITVNTAAHWTRQEGGFSS